MEIRTSNFAALLFVAVLLLSIAVGATRCAKIAKADDLPPLFLEYYLPQIENHPLSIGQPPDPIP